MTHQQDERFMAAALSLARRGLGRVSPNPAVGCLLVREHDGRPRVVGRGWTRPGGRPHAETEALAQARENARGATVYVTLEPCAHHGGTPPCTDALIAAGVARVVSAIEDPDPRVRGAGHRRLREARIAVTTGVLAGRARLVNAGFLSRVANCRPHVTLKLAVSEDGMIAAGPGVQTAITGREALDRAHMMRAQADAVMVGSRTWRSDDPLLTCRLAGLHDRSPVRIVLDARADLPRHARLVATARDVPLWIVTSNEAPAERRAALVAAGAEIVDCPVDAERRFGLPELLKHLAGRGITRLLVEGGGILAASLAGADLVDEVALFISTKRLGGEGVALPAMLVPETIEREGPFVLVSAERLGPDRLNTYRRG